MNAESTPSPVAVVQSRFVRLCRCSRRTCGLIFPEDEMAQTPEARRPHVSHGSCPKCKCRSFYPRNADGTKANLRDWKKSEWPISKQNDQVDAPTLGDCAPRLVLPSDAVSSNPVK